MFDPLVVKGGNQAAADEVTQPDPVFDERDRLDTMNVVDLIQREGMT